MKTFLRSIIITIAALAQVAQAAEPPLIFTQDGQALGQIVVADEPGGLGISCGGWRLDRSKTTRYAAEFLRSYLQKVSGANLPIVAASAADPTKPLLLVGASSLTGFVEEERKKLPPEGFLIRRQGSRVAIVGETAPENDLKEYRGADRGTVFGVFEFLERVAGVRWYFADELGMVIPPKPTLTVGALDIAKHPFFPMRTGAIRAGLKGEFGDLAPVTREGNSTGFHVNHTCYHWYKYVRQYPELFAVDANGQPTTDPSGPGGNKANHLCYSNPKTLELELQELREFDEQGVKHWEPSLQPSERYARFFPKDIENIYHCCCPRCQAQWIEGVDNSQLSKVIFGHTVQLANAIRKEHPNRRLAIGAYCGFLFPPASLRFPENVDVMVCTVKGNAALVNPAHWRQNVALIDQWSEKLGRDPKRLFLFEYLCYPSTDAPTLYPRTMQKWFRYLKTKGAGGFNNGYPERDAMHYRLALLNGWLWHKLLWNPDENVDVLLAGWYRDLFGPAEKPMAALFTKAIDCWENAPWPNAVNPGAVAYVPDQFIYSKVYAPEAVAQMKNRLRDARVAAPKDSGYARRVEFFGEAFDAFFQQAAAYRPSTASTRPEIPVGFVATPPVMDGALDDPAWQAAPALALVDWKTGGPPAAATTVRLLHDRQHLYVGAVMEAPDIAKLVAKGKERDAREILQDDRLEVDFDLRARIPLELETFYRVAVNSLGTVADGVQNVPLVHNSLHHSGWNEFWNADIKAAARRGDQEWSVELAIPLAAFPEYARKPVDRIPVQITRINRTPPKGTFSLSHMTVEEYEYDLSRLPIIVLKPE